MLSIFIPLGTGVRFTLSPNAKQKAFAQSVGCAKFPQKKMKRRSIVKAVDETVLTVSEYESDNGDALIKCHDDSAKTGNYLYMYRKNNVELECTITDLSLTHEEHDAVQTNTFTV